MNKAKITFRRNHTDFYSIYVYNSISPEDTGYLLAHYYNDAELIFDLISFGDVYKLEKFIFPNQNEEHNFKIPKYNITLFCIRDLGGNWKNNGFKFQNKLELERDVYYNYYWDCELDDGWICMESPLLDLYQSKYNISKDFKELIGIPIIKKA